MAEPVLLADVIAKALLEARLRAERAKLRAGATANGGAPRG